VSVTSSRTCGNLVNTSGTSVDTSADCASGRGLRARTATLAEPQWRGRQKPLRSVDQGRGAREPQGCLRGAWEQGALGGRQARRGKDAVSHSGDFAITPIIGTGICRHDPMVHHRPSWRTLDPPPYVGLGHAFLHLTRVPLEGATPRPLGRAGPQGPGNLAGQRRRRLPPALGRAPDLERPGWVHRLVAESWRCRRLGERPTGLRPALACGWGGRSRTRVGKPAAGARARGLQRVHSAGACVPLAGLLRAPQAVTAGLAGRRDAGAPPGGAHGLGGASAPTRRGEDHPGHPPGCRWRPGPRAHGPRGALGHEEAPPLHAVHRHIPHAPRKEPTLGRGGGGRGGRRGGRRGSRGMDLGQSSIDLLLAGHETSHRAHRPLRARQPTPQAHRARRGMPLWPVGDVSPQGEPALARGGRGSAAVVLEPGTRCGCTAAHPPVHAGTGDLPAVTDTTCRPAWIGERAHLPPGLGRRRMPVRGAPRPGPWPGRGTVLPELFDGLGVWAVAPGAPQHPRQLAILPARGACLQTRPGVDARLGPPGRCALGHDRDLVRDEAAQARPGAAPPASPHGCHGGRGCLGALLGGTLGTPAPRPAPCVAPWPAIDAGALQWGPILCRGHAGSPRRPSALPLPPRALHAGVLPRAAPRAWGGLAHRVCGRAVSRAAGEGSGVGARQLSPRRVGRARHGRGWGGGAGSPAALPPADHAPASARGRPPGNIFSGRQKSTRRP